MDAKLCEGWRNLRRMTGSERDLTPLGHLLEAARLDVLRISMREAARRAQMSEGRWRQIVTGSQSRGGKEVGARPSDRMVVAMALAVRVNPDEALTAAGLPVHPEHLAVLIADIRRDAPTVPASEEGPAAEVERIGRLVDVSPEDRLRMIRAVLDVWEEAKGQRAGPRKTA